MTRAAGPALLEAYLALEQRLRLPLEQYEAMLDELNDALQDVLESLDAPNGIRTRAATLKGW